MKDFLNIKSGHELEFTTKTILSCDEIWKLVEYKNLQNEYLVLLEQNMLIAAKRNRLTEKLSMLHRLQVCLLNQIESKIDYLKKPLSLNKVRINKIQEQHELLNTYRQKIKRHQLNARIKDFEVKYLKNKLRSILKEDELKEIFEEIDNLKENIKQNFY